MTEEEQKKRDENALKRIATFVKTYSDIVDSGKFDKNKFTINASFASNAVNHYLDDLDALKKRYKISDLVQMPKIAGLMANAILRYRPIVPINGKETNIGDIDINEYVAIYHGLAVCAGEGKASEDKIRQFIRKNSFENWFKGMIFLLKKRNYTAESLYMIFETIRSM
jgi:hypothetical protein